MMLTVKTQSGKIYKILVVKVISDHGFALWNTVIKIFFSCGCFRMKLIHLFFTPWHVPSLHYVWVCPCSALSNKGKHFFIQGIPPFFYPSQLDVRVWDGIWMFPLVIPAQRMMLRSYTVHQSELCSQQCHRMDPSLSNESKMMLQQFFSKQSIILKSSLHLINRQFYLRNVLSHFCGRNIWEFSQCHVNWSYLL